MMRWRLILVGICLAPLVAAGCGMVVPMGPGAVLPGVVFADVGYPNARDHGQLNQVKTVTAKDVEILGPAHAEKASTRVVYQFVDVSGGDSGYGELLKSMRGSMGADGFLNVTVDTKFRHIYLLLATIQMAETRVTGLAYRLKSAAGP